MEQLNLCQGQIEQSQLEGCWKCLEFLTSYLYSIHPVLTTRCRVRWMYTPCSICTKLLHINPSLSTIQLWTIVRCAQWTFSPITCPLIVTGQGICIFKFYVDYRRRTWKSSWACCIGWISLCKSPIGVFSFWFHYCNSPSFEEKQDVRT